MSETDDDKGPVCIKVVWDNPMNPDLRLMRAIQSLIDASAQHLNDGETADVLAYLHKKYAASANATP
jgi:hypothetical protein